MPALAASRYQVTKAVTPFEFLAASDMPLSRYDGRKTEMQAGVYHKRLTSDVPRGG